MQKFILSFLIGLFCSLQVCAFAATTQTIHVEWGYTPPSSPAVTGFKLYQEGSLACQTQNPHATAMDCQVSLTKDTTNFTLTATFSDSTESPHSAPFPFTSGTTPPPDTTTSPPNTTTPPTTTGSKLFTFSWQSSADPATLKGYRIYLNNGLLCETTTPTATSLACQADLIQGLMTFSMTAVATSGAESSPSNLLVFDPTAYPELFTAKRITLSWDYPATATVTGFRAYQNSKLIGETKDPAARTLACTADITTATVSYAVTAINPDGSETAISNLLTYTADSTTPGTADLSAVITASTTNGPAPLSIGFSASASTGTIASHLWDFGDGSSATTQTANHIYTTPGTYSAKLTVADSTGKSSTTSVTVTASTATSTPATLPKAVISSSAATGPAPITVSFDGSGSTATNATIVSHKWSFGDGSSDTKSSTSHTYTTAGTYTASLTVTDSNGQIGQASTPVIVTAPSSTSNTPPKAVFSATPTTGSAPLAVTFNGGGSTDSDGTISSYVWNFGDGNSATGKTASHTYATNASFTATLEVTDDKGAKGSTSVTIIAKAEEPTDLKLETGDIAVTTSWVRVPLSSTFTSPIVIVGPPTFNNSEPCVVRLRNVDKTGFDIRLEEWNYQDGTHPKEMVSYLVLEKGRHTLADGSSIEAGAFTGTTSFKTVPFSKAFSKNPVVFTTIASTNEADTISGRVREIGLNSFHYYFREQEKNTNTHKNETVNFVAWEPGKGSIGTVQFEVGNTTNIVTHAWYSVAFQSSHQQPPLLLAGMQTTANSDTSALRVQQLASTGFQVKVEEEQSKDIEVSHPAETVGYLALNQPAEKVSATFTWTFDPAQEATISGFAILANGEQVCTIDSPSARTQSCEISMPSGPTDFTIQAKVKTGGTSSPSNSITYTP